MNQSNNITGFFKSEPTRPASSIDAAISIGLVARHHDDGFMYIRGVGRFSIAEALRQGMIDQAGAAALAAQQACVGRPPAPVVLSAVPVARAADFAGTPVGNLVEALQTWRRQPDAQETIAALGMALEAFQQAAKVTV